MSRLARFDDARWGGSCRPPTAFAAGPRLAAAQAADRMDDSSDRVPPAHGFPAGGKPSLPDWASNSQRTDSLDARRAANAMFIYISSTSLAGNVYRLSIPFSRRGHTAIVG